MIRLVNYFWWSAYTKLFIAADSNLIRIRSNRIESNQSTIRIRIDSIRTWFDSKIKWFDSNQFELHWFVRNLSLEKTFSTEKRTFCVKSIKRLIGNTIQSILYLPVRFVSNEYIIYRTFTTYKWKFIVLQTLKDKRKNLGFFFVPKIDHNDKF